MKQRIAITATLLLALAVGIACSAATNYALWTTAGQLIDSWIDAYAPGWSGKAQLDSTWAAAGQDILNWKSGSECQNVETAINDALTIAAGIPVSDPKYALLLATAEVGADVVETYFVKCSTASVAAAAHIQMRAAKAPTVMQSALAEAAKTPPKDASELKKQWKQRGGK